MLTECKVNKNISHAQSIEGIIVIYQLQKQKYINNWSFDL